MSVPLKPVLSAQNVTLRDARPSDAEARLELGRNPEIERCFGLDPSLLRELTIEHARDWVAGIAANPMEFVITVDGTLVGATRLHSLVAADRRASFAIGIISAAHLGRGHGTTAGRLLLSHGFDTLGLHRIGCRVLAFNARAIASYRKLGFVEEGREREAAQIGDEWHDDVMMGLLARDFEAGT
ncbi:putative acetyltransferase [Candidatus Rhodobacter oscarellae]|uniref:Putative acetyltransferase n=1 Tax=Candidatus Rhodobacter oscarellae TaxID=1675527 RepID=A0A0J9E6Z9_9RHOB|nr:GNAT family protein [Candidatus Rhodobacter lobularis]KMW57584.1 putative acetyltransferase [Candidatus Rhodobacter lobularis]